MDVPQGAKHDEEAWHDEQDISIDIHVPKLLEWLISRRHCPATWQLQVVKIRAKINEAIQDMPENKEIAALLTGSYINYFHCLKIVEILKETEADSKNIFGRYSSKRMKDWQEIISLYTKNNVYLAEAADLLISIVKYEIPTIKKLIAKQHQLENEFKKKEVDSTKSINTAKNELASLLKELGLSGNISGFKESLLSTAKQLQSENENVAQEIKNLYPALEHYEMFTAFSQPNQKVDLALIKYISDKGNTTTYQWQTGVVPTKTVLPKLVAELEDEINSEDTIDWGYDVTSGSEEIELIDSGEAKNAEVEEKKESDPNEIIATGEQALLILDNIHFRTNLINQILELQTFVKSRLFESEKQGAIDAIVESISSIKEMSATIDKILNLLTNTTTQHYFNILYYPKYLEDILQKIKKKESAIERSIAISAMAKERIIEAGEEIVTLTKKTQIIVRKGRELQNDIQKDISQRYNGRIVNLMGGPAP